VLRDELLMPFKGPKPGEVRALREFAFLPDEVIERLKASALDEEWGAQNFVLIKYLAEHIPLSLEQERYTWFEDQLVVTAGSLQTRYSTPLYLVFERNQRPDAQPWFLKAATNRPRSPDLPQPPNLPRWPEIDPGSEIVIAHEHILDDNQNRVNFLENAPPVAQMCAVSGAIQWAIHRELVIPQLYFGTTSFFVPVYLTSREDATSAPDLVAPVQVQPRYLVARTLLLPHMAYARARVAVPRADRLPSWLLHAWADHASSLESDIDDDRGLDG
jgi:hypothetical protein